jgi:hypothetical protein
MPLPPLHLQTPIPATLPPPQAPLYTLPPPFLLYLQRNKYKVDVELCEYIIHACPQVVKHKDAYGNYPLHAACSKSPYTQYAGMSYECVCVYVYVCVRVYVCAQNACVGVNSICPQKFQLVSLTHTHMVRHLIKTSHR